VDETFSQLNDERMTAEAVKAIKDTQEIPKTFYQRPDGLVVPERLRNPEPEITICGHVDEIMFEKTSKELERIATGNTVINGLRVNFTSFGGDVTSGFGVHDLLTVFGREHNAPITVTGYGPIMSMGALIIQAGDTRRMPRNSRMLLHPNSRGMSDEVQRLEHRVQEARALQTIYSEIVSERVRRSGKDMSPEQVTTYMEANNGVGTYLTSQQALDLGLIDEVI
jgi:ATP-dependent protease ClpP protease subunit